ncbi:uncharacterized protein LOC129796897 [Lutzomyia longipalpis]|uniref:uncharacterized protein LOC129796897 n=1 Tax=Lutzomyia longipalpis TaxID=7200 RepID=UPI00248351B9|nr:uncharacterized protein LOC129796897 [Lutzomyia longipalpis]
MGIVLRIVVLCVVIAAVVQCEYPSEDARITLRKLRQLPPIPEWPPGTESPDNPIDPEVDGGVIPDWPPTSEPPPTDNAANDSSAAWMVTAIVFIVLFVIAVGICIYMFATLPPRYSNNKTFTLPRVNTPAH